MNGWMTRVGGLFAALLPAARFVGGRRYFVTALLPALWPLFLAGLSMVPGWEARYEADDVTELLVGAPLALLALFLGVRVIAGEIDQRTLEVAYTVPGGTRRVWTAKLIAAGLLLLAAEFVALAVVRVMMAEVEWVSALSVFEAALFFLALGCWAGARLRGELSAILVGIVPLALALTLSSTEAVSVITPFWDPLDVPDKTAAQLLATAVRNRIGYALAIAGLLALAFDRAEKREIMLGG